MAGAPALVTYCPLCATGVVFDPVVNLPTGQAGGKALEFGVSGRLWQSNLLMYDRQGNEDDETLWSQVLGEGVVGPLTGTRLNIISADTVRWADWKEDHPSTEVLSRETGISRSYGRDPYEGYYTSTEVSFGATFSDDRLHPKTFVLGVEVAGKFKAYDFGAIPQGSSSDAFVDQTIRFERAGDEIRMYINNRELAYIGGFWFSWLAVHPATELFK